MREGVEMEEFIKQIEALRQAGEAVSKLQATENPMKRVDRSFWVRGWLRR